MVSAWEKEYPGDKLFTCENCGIYFASKDQCEKCQETEHGKRWRIENKIKQGV